MHDFSLLPADGNGWARHGVLNAPKQKEELRIGERFLGEGDWSKTPPWGVLRLGTHRDLINETLVEILNLPITSQANWTKMSDDILAQVGLKASLQVDRPRTHPP